MDETIRIIIGILLVGYYLWCCFSIYRLITNRTSKPKITLGGVGWAAIVLLVNIVVFKLVIDCPWRIALIFGLVAAIVGGAIVVLRFLYQRSR
jgi:multisubunit Na+/H+ antiporter MnhF subunit